MIEVEMSNKNDPWGLISDFEQALRSSGLAGEGEMLERAATRLVVTKGRCLLADLEPAGGVPPKSLLAAEKMLRNTIPFWRLAAENVQEQLNDCVDPSEADEVLRRLLEFRLDLMAAMMVLPKTTASKFAALVNTLDDSLFARRDLFVSPVTEGVRRNMKLRIDPKFHAWLPWFLQEASSC